MAGGTKPRTRKAEKFQDGAKKSGGLRTINTRVRNARASPGRGE
jgi:hypothetical protein